MASSILKFVRSTDLEPCYLGNLEVRLAETAQEIRAAQELRYAVFYEEMAARPDTATRLAWRDADAFDSYCDHLVVIDNGIEYGPQVVGTYRLIDQAAASAAGGFYSSGEYDLSALLALTQANGRPARLLELGRSCVAPSHRTSGTIMLLWRGIAAYLEALQIDFMFGCASFPGTDPNTFASELTLLDGRYKTPLAVKAHDGLYESMKRVSLDSVDELRTWRALPPLVRGYLQAGAMVGDGAYVDHQFGTVDVFMIVATSQIRNRYRARFTPVHA